MVNDRLELHERLCEIINIVEADKDRHVYFQPPESIRMKYPAIRYKLDSIENTHASNNVYNQKDRYEAILIDSNPDSEYVRQISLLPRCRFVRHYTANNLNHWVFTLYH